MNSQELELSLRAEFESYVKELLTEVRQEISQIQEKFNSDVEKHKTEINFVLQEALAKVENRHELAPSLQESLVEHLRLSKDEGARITATALDEAEQLKLTEPQITTVAAAATTGSTAANLSEISDAVSDIGSRQSQAEVLASLMNHAEKFAPRGAFFILKNERLGAWRSFGTSVADSEKLQDISVAAEAESAISEALNSLKTVTAESGKYAEDGELLKRLDFTDGKAMAAIPLVARGRGVAVMYADEAGEGTNLNSSALEILMRVAGLTVERLASAKEAAMALESRPEQTVENAAPETAAVAAPETATETAPEIERNDAAQETETVDYNKTVQMSRDELLKEAQPEDPAKTTMLTEPVVETAEDSAASQTDKPKLSWREKNSQLPIEVAEEERADHIEAQRFARLLVSEIKLYNEQRLAQGRKIGDLYDRLREPIDRSREAYQSRVKPAVNSKFDYLHNEMLKTLAQGDVKKFGAGYPGEIIK